MTRATKAEEWSYIRTHAWRYRGGDGERWSREMTPRMVFLAQSNASGFPRLFGLLLTFIADATFNWIGSPLLMRGWMRAYDRADCFRWWLERHAAEFARYNRPA